MIMKLKRIWTLFCYMLQWMCKNRLCFISVIIKLGILGMKFGNRDYVNFDIDKFFEGLLFI